MLSAHNILSPATASPSRSRRRTLVLGLYYLTRRQGRVEGEGRVFSSFDEVVLRTRPARSPRTPASRSGFTGGSSIWRAQS